MMLIIIDDVIGYFFNSISYFFFNLTIKSL